MKGVCWVPIMLVGDVFAALCTENLMSTIGEVAFLKRGIFFVEGECKIWSMDRRRARMVQWYTMYRINVPWWKRYENGNTLFLWCVWYDEVSECQLDWSQPDGILTLPTCCFPNMATPPPPVVCEQCLESSNLPPLVGDYIWPWLAPMPTNLPKLQPT